MISGIDLFLGLFNNLALFIVLVAIYGALDSMLDKSPPYKRQILFGFFFGFFAITCMYAKIPVAQGVIVDQRNTIVVLSGIFGGPLAALICAIMTAIFRAYMGGAGIYGGIMGIVLAAATGIGLHFLRIKIDTVFKTAISAIAASIMILPGFLLVGDFETGWELLKAISLPYGLAVFLGIFFLSLLLANEEYRNKSKLELKKSEERFRKFFENLVDVSYRTDIIGKITLISPSSKEVFGFSPDEMIGKKMADFYHDPALGKKFISSIKKQGHIKNFESKVIKKDGSCIWVSTNAKLLKDFNGSIIGVEGITRDISMLKKSEKKRLMLEASLRQSQKMEAIGELAGGIAHDFNNILSGIFGFSQLAKRHIKDTLRATKDINQIINGAQKATDLVQQILSFSRKSNHSMVQLSFCSEVKESIKLLRSSIPSTIEIKENIASEAIVLADKTQIHQIMMNLCTNAYHAMKKTGGILSISLKDVEIPERNNIDDIEILPGYYLKLEISDTGSGMTPETMEKLFEPYFTTKEIGQGTGIGLAIVHAIVKKHKGFIKAYSTLGKGSSVHIYFPISANKADAISKIGKIDAFKGGTERIMFVDDDESILTSTRQFLEEKGYKVSTFSNGKHAFTEFEKDPYQFDLILTDMTMPQMTGEELSSRSLKIRRDMPVILCTGYSDKINRVRALKIGVRKYLQKPIDNRELLVSIREALNKN